MAISALTGRTSICPLPLPDCLQPVHPPGGVTYTLFHRGDFIGVLTSTYALRVEIMPHNVSARQGPTPIGASNTYDGSRFLCSTGVREAAT